MNAVEQSFWGNFKASAEIKVPFWGKLVFWRNG
jgi:hypothetical protein